MEPPTPGDVMVYTGMILAAFSLLAFQILMRRIAQALLALWDQGIVIAGPSSSGLLTETEPNAGQSPIKRVINQFQLLISSVKRQLNSRGRSGDPPEPPKNTDHSREAADPERGESSNNQLVQQYLAYIGNYERWLNHWGSGSWPAFLLCWR